MGLDITAYRQLVKAPAGSDPEADWDRCFRFYVNPEFSGRDAGLEPGTVYVRPEPSATYEFRAGSYRGYNDWRNALARLAGFARGAEQAWNDGLEHGPFIELINFSDCEGVIGPVVSAKLARDFAEWQERANSLAEKGRGAPWCDAPVWFLGLYAHWRKAFEMAADGGAVALH
jgi:hypothetical protein